MLTSRYFHTNGDGASVIFSSRRVGSGAGITHPDRILALDTRIRFKPVPEPDTAVDTFLF
jgi:hypothetical protein